VPCFALYGLIKLENQYDRYCPRPSFPQQQKRLLLPGRQTV
jgi:hypothetical protein